MVTKDGFPSFFTDPLRAQRFLTRHQIFRKGFDQDGHPLSSFELKATIAPAYLMEERPDGQEGEDTCIILECRPLIEATIIDPETGSAKKCFVNYDDKDLVSVAPTHDAAILDLASTVLAKYGPLDKIAQSTPLCTPSDQS